MFSKKSEYSPASNDENFHEENVSRGIEMKKSKKIAKEESDLKSLEESPKSKDTNKILTRIKKIKRPIALAISILFLISFIILLLVIIKSRNENTKKEIKSYKIKSSNKTEQDDSNQQSIESFNDIQKTNSKTLVGTWEFESQENFDEFLQEMGVGFFIRKFASLSKPTLIISNEGEYWTIKRSGGPKEMPPITFRNNEEFVEQAFSGDLKSRVIIESPRKQTHISVGDEGETIAVREVIDDDKMKLTIQKKGGNVVCTRWFNRAKDE